MANFDDEMKIIEEALNKYEEEQVGLPKLEQTAAPAYLSMPLDDLRKKTPEELSEATIEIARYSLFIERSINRQKAWERWAKLKSDEYTAHYLGDVPDRYGFNERVLIARNNPEPCKILNKFIREIEMKLSRLYNVPKHISIIADAINNLKYIALKREKND